MKLARALFFLWLVGACALPCAARERRVRKHTGLHPVADARGKWGFIDRTGRFRIAPRYDGAGQFSEGLAYVWFWDGKRGREGVVDADGKLTELPETNDFSFVFRDGLGRFQTPLGVERKYGYVDKTGRVVIPPQFDDSGHFSEGLAWVSVLKERKWLYGFIDKTGKVVIEPQFRETSGFSEGLAAVKIIGSDGHYMWGYIDRAGRFAVAPLFRQADPFAGGLARVVTTDGKKQLIDATGKVIWQPRN
jgi:hypothetical protein